MTALLGDVVGRDAVIVDDIIFTGGTLWNMAEVVKAGGPARCAPWPRTPC